MSWMRRSASRKNNEPESGFRPIDPDALAKKLRLIQEPFLRTLEGRVSHSAQLRCPLGQECTLEDVESSGMLSLGSSGGRPILEFFGEDTFHCLGGCALSKEQQTAIHNAAFAETAEEMITRPGALLP